MNTNFDFAISGIGDNFINRSKNIFGDLDKIEANHHESYLKNPQVISDSSDFMKPDPEQDDYLTNVSSKKFSKPQKDGFKIPSGKPLKSSAKEWPPKGRDMSKWTEYSLSDVTPNQMSESANVQASKDALKRNYLDISSEIHEDGEEDNDDDSPKKHVFRKPSPKISSDSEQKVRKLNENQKVCLHFEENDSDDDNDDNNNNKNNYNKESVSTSPNATVLNTVEE
ncbi:hypothetical protein HELRODRAFT_160040 [Helobdella robusta]|uniref:Uncharacterized protein n=1 Tax=Helobdella robusta TaxID=6412 RepID=T1EPP9_HELRO|nr:hypothetical protein HELRODRAFT_160040 [Helobdella robusta]ESO05941.1 hypothetical protein HELRODRAFT_160040 [Helobdella robusta]